MKKKDNKRQQAIREQKKEYTKNWYIKTQKRKYEEKKLKSL